MKYADMKDIDVAIQCLKVISERKLSEHVKLKIVPSLNRVIMELEDLQRKEKNEQIYKELSKSD